MKSTGYTGDSGVSILSWIALLLALGASSLLVGSGFGYRLQWWALPGAFSMLQWGAYLGVAAVVVGAISAIMAISRGVRRSLPAVLVAIILGAACAFIPWQWQQKARTVPPIHDISTDTLNPPDFVAIRPLRSNSPNPTVYDVKENAEATRQAYPDVKTLFLDLPYDRVFNACREVIDLLGWELVSADKDAGRLEATDTTRWFGFKDDVVVRIASRGDQTVVDLRSTSRVGKSDVGTNAKRIRKFRDKLLASLGV